MKRLALLSFLLVFAATAAHASGPESFVHQTVDSFQAGTFLGTVLDSNGVLRAGPAVRAVVQEEIDGFSALAPHPGGGIVVGTAKGGSLLRYRKGAFKPLFKSADKQDQRVTALAVVRGEIWAAFAPSGRLLRVDASGKATAVKGLQGKYIWAIRPTGREVLLAVGAPAAVLRMSEGGKVLRRIEVEAGHVMDVAVVGGEIWAATALPGRVVRLGKGSFRQVIFESGPRDEVRRLVAGGEGAYAVVNSGAPTSSSASKMSSKGKKKGFGKGGNARRSKRPEGDAFGLASPPAKPAPRPKGASVWRLDRDGTATILSTVGPGVALDATWYDGRGLLVALSREGRAILVDDRGDALIWIDSEARAIDGLLVGPRGRGFAITSGGASVLEIGPKATRPRFLSPVLDAGSSARVGAVSTVGIGVRVEVRTGTTSAPDDAGWTPFVAAPGDGVPKVARGRYLQYRVALQGKGAHLRAIRLSYRTRNLRPRLGQIDVVDRKAKVPSLFGKKKNPRLKKKGIRDGSKVLLSVRSPVYTGIKRIAWTSLDLDGDDLRFHVEVRPVGSGPWLRLSHEGGTPFPYLDWLVADYPDGLYEIRVRASDAASNPPGEGYETEALGGPVRIDNSAPEIADLQVGGGRVSFRVRDAGAPLARVQVATSPGPGAWQDVAPADGLLDGWEERFSVKLSDLGDTGPGLLRVRAVDAFGHFAVAGKTVR